MPRKSNAEKPMAPLKAPTKTPQDSELVFPCFASYKIDGLRAIITEAGVMSNSLKPHPNGHCQQLFAKDSFFGFDGEMVEGAPNTPDTYNRSMSAISTIGGEPDLHFYVFDICTRGMLEIPFEKRLEMLSLHFETLVEAGQLPENVHFVHHQYIENKKELDDFEALALELGYEGIMTRKPDGCYKFGRSTMKQALLHKIKRYVDAEAVIIGFEEELTNLNEQTINAMGLAERGHSKENRVPAGRLGALIVKDVLTGVQFKIGSGFSHALKQDIWMKREMWLGAFVTYKHFPHGDYDAPRHPVYKGIRNISDVDNHNVTWMLHHESESACIEVNLTPELQDQYSCSGVEFVSCETFSKFVSEWQFKGVSV